MVEPKPLLVNAAAVHTCEPPFAPAESILIRGNRIAALGSRTELQALAGDARVLDLPGTVITPGLTDAHVHLTEWALARRHADLAEADSPEHALDLLLRHGAPGSGWVHGRGWNEHRWGGQRAHRALLDQAFPDRPVALQSHDMHALWVNSAALAAAGIDASTPDPEGGRIERGPDGAPTGILLERAGEILVAATPQPSEADVVEAVRAAQPVLHALGLTGVHSFPGISLPDPEPVTVAQLLRERGELRIRTLNHVRVERLDHAIGARLRSGLGDAWVRIGGVKLFLDGALGSRTAWMREPYEHSDSIGVCVLGPQPFEEIVARAAAAGIATTVHAIGDAAVGLALDVLAKPQYHVPGLPHRIEHVQCCPPERLADAGRADIVCSVQPCHLITDWRAADRHWGPQRAGCSYAFASLARGGAVLAFGSDAPVEPIDPRRSLFAAVQRQDLAGNPADGWFPQERIERLAALRAFTTGPALAAGAGGQLGALVPGALADLVAWDRDPLTCAAEELLQLNAVATLVDGVLMNT